MKFRFNNFFVCFTASSILVVWFKMTIHPALHTFVVLAKSATHAACADLIKQATSANGVYTFTPLLDAENVQKVHSPNYSGLHRLMLKLAGTEHEKSLELLKLFSWGTYQDYKGTLVEESS